MVRPPEASADLAADAVLPCNKVHAPSDLNPDGVVFRMQDAMKICEDERVQRSRTADK